jgi:hypothetical protein
MDCRKEFSAPTGGIRNKMNMKTGRAFKTRFESVSGNRMGNESPADRVVDCAGAWGPKING